MVTVWKCSWIPWLSLGYNEAVYAHRYILWHLLYFVNCVSMISSSILDLSGNMLLKNLTVLLTNVIFSSRIFHWKILRGRHEMKNAVFEIAPLSISYFSEILFAFTHTLTFCVCHFSLQHITCTHHPELFSLRPVCCLFDLLSIERVHVQGQEKMGSLFHESQVKRMIQ